MDECAEAEAVGNAGRLYRGLKKIGLKDMKKDKEETKITTEEFKNHFMKVSEERFENDPQEIEETVDLVEDLRENEKAKEWKERLNMPPEN